MVVALYLYPTAMSLGQVALGLASLAMAAHHFKNGVRHFGGSNKSALDGCSACATGSVGQTMAWYQQRDPAGFRRMVAQSRRDVDRMIRRERQQGLSASIDVPGRAFMDSGRHEVVTSQGTVPMRMRSYNIRTLDQRIAYLKKLADEGKRDPQVYAFARRSLSRRCGNDWCVREKDNLGEAKSLFGAMRRAVPPNTTMRDLAAARGVFKNARRRVRYTSDILGVDTYQKPAHTLALSSGDCDDYSSLTCSALGSLGIPCRYKVIRTRGAKDWNHIYAQAGLPRANPARWITMDSSVNMPFGWEAPKSMVADSRVFRVG